MRRQLPRLRCAKHPNAIALVLLASIYLDAPTALGLSRARADGIIARHGRPIATALSHARSTCTNDPDACASSLLRGLTGLAFGVVTAAIGATHTGAAGGVTADITSVKYPLATADLGKIEALYVSHPRNARVRFTVANLKAVFSCRDPHGALHPPIVGHMLYACLPGSRFGLGALVGELSWDPGSRRKTARWGEVAAVVNLAGATSSMAYVRGHLDAALRVGGESVWHGIGETRADSDHIARVGVSLDGVARSQDGHWEATLQVALRPAILGTVAPIRDYGVTAETTALYHVRFASNTVVSTGIDVRVSHWNDPSMAIGSFDSTIDRTTLFAGVVVGVRHESKP